MFDYAETKERCLNKRDIIDIVERLSTEQQHDVLDFLITKYEIEKEEPPCTYCKAKQACAVLNSYKQFRVLSKWESCDKFMELNECGIEQVAL